MFTNLAGAICHGELAKRPGLIVVGSLLLLFAGAISFFSASVKVRTINWLAIKPVWWLALDAENAGSAPNNVALNELIRRMSSSEIGVSDAQSIVKRALRIQGNSGAPWNYGWGELIELAHEQSLISGDDWKLYAQQALKDALTLKLRKRIEIGDPVPFRIECASPRAAAYSSLSYSLQHQYDFVIGGLAVHRGFSSGSNRCMGTPRIHRPATGSMTHLKPGKSFESQGGPLDLHPTEVAQIHLGKVRVKTSVSLKVKEDSSGDILFDQVLSLADDAEFVSPEGALVQLVTDPLLMPSFTPSLEFNAPNGSNSLCHLSWYDLKLHTDVAFDVVLWTSREEVRLGDMSTPQGISSPKGWTWEIPQNIFTQLTAADSNSDTVGKTTREISIILRPNIAAARRSVECTRIWGEPIELRFLVRESGKTIFLSVSYGWLSVKR